MDIAAAILGGLNVVGDIINPTGASEKRQLAEDQIKAQREQIAADKAKAEAGTKNVMYMAAAAVGVVLIGAVAFVAFK